MTKKDYIIASVITLIYTVLAFINLGSTQEPQTFSKSAGTQTVMVDFGSKRDVLSISMYTGIGSASFDFYTLNENNEEVKVGSINMPGCFTWYTTDLCTMTQRVLVRASGGDINVGELGFFDYDNRLIPVEQYTSTIGDSANLFDEQQLVQQNSWYYNGMYFDEIYHARTAYEFINGLSPYEITHPPLGKVIIALGILMFKMTPFGWRFMGTLFGCVMVFLIYLFGKKMFRNTFWATIVTILFTFDFMHFAQTRIATIDTYGLFFTILMYMFMFMFIQYDIKKTPIRKLFACLLICGVFFGLGAASKWTCLYGGAGLAVIFFIHIIVQAVKGLDKKKLAIILSGCLVFFILIPALIYAASYIPFVRCEGQNWGQALSNQSYMYNYHAHLTATHPYSSKWYEWMTMVKPIVYTRTSPAGDPNTLSTIASFGNPAVWWLGIIAILYALYQALLKREKTAVFLVIGYAAQLVPWMFVSRIMFIYHYFSCTPFLVLAIVYMLRDFVAKKPRAIYAVYIYTALAVALFIMFYPVLSGVHAPAKYISDYLIWFPQWYFV